MRVAGLDLGLKRLGLAILLIDDVIVPVEPILRKNRNQAAKDLDNWLSEWSIDKLVVGVPHEGADAQEMNRRIMHFTSLLNFKGEIIFVEEDFSSFEAKESLKGVLRDDRSGKLDSVAAKIILERWLFKNKLDS